MLAILGGKVVMLTVIEGTMGGLLVLEAEVELSTLENDEEVAFEEIVRFGPARGGCIWGNG